MYNVRAKVEEDPDHLRPTAHHHAVPTVHSVQPTPVGNGGLLARTSGGRWANGRRPQAPRDTQIESQSPDFQTLDSQEVLSLLLEACVYGRTWQSSNGKWPSCKSLVGCCRQSHLFTTYLGRYVHTLSHSLTHSLTRTLAHTPLPPPFSSSPAPVVSLHLHSPV